MVKPNLHLPLSSRALVCMPHPDDEAVFVRGLLQQLSSQHIPTKCITFTAGENSTLRFGLKPDQDLATVRKHELAKAYQTLGITDFTILEFLDGSLEKHAKKITAHIQKEIQSFLPTHLITLETDGVYGHPDHIALTRYVIQSAVKSAIVFATVKPGFIMPSARSMAKKTIIQPLLPSHKLTLSPLQALTKLRAVMAHQSQFFHHTYFTAALAHFLRNDMLFHEYYAYKGGPL